MSCCREGIGGQSAGKRAGFQWISWFSSCFFQVFEGFRRPRWLGLKLRYKAGKYTPLDNLLNPYWIRMAEALPRWLAPNLVTLLGFFPLVVSYSLGAVVAPSFETPPPRWLMLFSTLALFVYQTMDALDGKQARRTGSSSPLGQLFDHGCDCLACLAQTGAAASLHHFGPNFLGLWSITILPPGAQKGL